MGEENIINEFKNILKSGDFNNIKNKDPKDISEGFLTCKYCGKRIPISKMKLVNSSVKHNILDPICDECFNEFSKMKVVSIACLGCNEIIARMNPKKYKSGFETKSGNIYHIMDCPSCNPKKWEDNPMASSSIIEEQIYNSKLSKKDR